MASFVLSCCSTADLSREHFLARDVSYICFHYILDGVEYSDDLGQSIPFEDFYHRMATGAETTTSQVSMGEFIEYFEPMLKEGKDILHVSLSSGISGSYGSAQMAAEELSAKYPDRKIYVVDSLGASSGYGLLMETLADKRDEGMDIDALYAFAQEKRLYLHHWFFSTDLSFYVKGGRISPAAGFFGGLLGICPLLNMDDAGHLIPREKIRSKKKVIDTIVERMAQHAEGGLAYSGKCFISQSGCVEDARAVADRIEAKFPKLNGKVEINYVGTTIGSHTGPGTVALFFWGDERKA